MPYLYLVISILCFSFDGIVGAFYNRKNEGFKNTTPIYNLLISASIFIVWFIALLFNFKYDLGVLIYAVIFGVFYCASTFGLINALKTGPVILTTLLFQLSLIVVSIWGFIFWNSKISLLVIIGLVLTAVALYLCLYNGKKEEKKTITLKWLIYALLGLFGNAGCTIAQRTQQMKFNGEYGEFLMAVATFISLIYFIIAFIVSDRKETKMVFKKSWYFPVIGGVNNFILNLFVLLLATTVLSPSLIYPSLAIVSLIITTLFSMFVFKEKMFWWQWLGVAFGIIATGILSI